MFLEFGLSHSKILDCSELLRIEELEIFFKSCYELKMESKSEPSQP